MSYLGQYYEKMKEVGIRMNHQFIVDIPKLGPDFMFFATTADLPGRTIEENEVPFHGVTFRTPSVTTFPGEMTITVRSDMANEIRSLIEIWANDHADLAMGGGGKKRIPSELAHLYLLDETLGNAYTSGDENVRTDICNAIASGTAMPNSTGCTGEGGILRTYVLAGIFPGEYGAISMDTASPDISTFDLTLKYQYWYEADNNPLG